jgi:flagellar biosynthetic protein FliR
MMPDDLPLVLVAAALLLSVRVGAALRLTPFFGGHPMPVLPWLGLSLSLGLLLATHFGAAGVPALDGPRLAALVIKELFVGIVIGVLTRLAFSVFEVVGEIAHLSSFAVFSTPDRNPLATAYRLLGVSGFLVLGGHHGLIQGLASTAHCVAPFELPGWEPFAGAGQDAAVRLFAAAMATAVLISAPIFAAGLFADVVVGVLSRLQSGAAMLGAQTVRAVAVQLVVVLSLGLVVTSAIELLESGLESLSLCP